MATDKRKNGHFYYFLKIEMYFSLKYLISLSGSMYGCVGKQKISLCDVKRVVMGEPTKDKNVDLNKNIFARFVFVWTFGA